MGGWGGVKKREGCFGDIAEGREKDLPPHAHICRPLRPSFCLVQQARSLSVAVLLGTRAAGLIAAGAFCGLAVSRAWRSGGYPSLQPAVEL